MKASPPASSSLEGEARGPAAQAKQHRAWTRQQVSPGDFGRAVRFEIEHEDGTVVRFLGDEAEKHVCVLTTACAMVGDRMTWPTALPEVSKNKPTAGPPDPAASVLLRRESQEGAPDWPALCDALCKAMFRWAKEENGIPEWAWSAYWKAKHAVEVAPCLPREIPAESQEGAAAPRSPDSSACIQGWWESGYDACAEDAAAGHPGMQRVVWCGERGHSIYCPESPHYMLGTAAPQETITAADRAAPAAPSAVPATRCCNGCGEPIGGCPPGCPGPHSADDAGPTVFWVDRVAGGEMVIIRAETRNFGILRWALPLHAAEPFADALARSAAPLREPAPGAPEGPCCHGRPSWKMCPHCLGLGYAAVRPPEAPEIKSIPSRISPAGSPGARDQEKDKLRAADAASPSASMRAKLAIDWDALSRMALPDLHAAMEEQIRSAEAARDDLWREALALRHINQGGCPDEDVPDDFDPKCPACVALRALWGSGATEPSGSPKSSDSTEDLEGSNPSTPPTKEGR